MKFKYIFSSVLGSALLLSSCMDKFGDINTNPSVVTDADIRFQFTQLENDFIPSDYWAWYYDYSNMLKWGQITVSGGGNEEKLNEKDESSGGANTIKKMISSYRDIQYKIANMPKERGAGFKHIEAMSNVLTVYMVLLNTDMYGSRPYSELGLARYGGTLTPKYDTQEQLLNDFLTQLETDVKILSSKTYSLEGRDIAQINAGKQDLFFAGNAESWAKLANSMRLKVAARLINHDKAKALEVVNAAAKEPIGFITDKKDNAINYKGIKYYGPNDNPGPGTPSYQIIEFMKENRDPRLRFFFTKNSYNSKVVQAYFDAKQSDPNQPDLPKYIADKVEFEVKDGKKVFKGWKEPGEPWVRYHGLPVTIDAKNDVDWKEYFDAGNYWSKISIKNDKGEKFEKTYGLMSGMQMQHFKNNNKLTYPDSPLVTVTPDTDPRILYTFIMNSAEVNLYLAEFKLLGANLPQTAAEYFTKGIRESVESWNEMSAKNKIRYYETVYDENEAPIKLQDGEVDKLLEKEAYNLTGNVTEDLEKVYLQQRFNFIFMPQEVYVTMRRSGYPKFDSKIYPFEHFNKDKSEYLLPRRFSFRAPADTDMMKPIYEAMLQEQGFSIGYLPTILNSERVWYDKNAPQFGAGSTN